MISASDCRQAVELIEEAVNSGAALYKACEELGISKRTYNRWRNTDNDHRHSGINYVTPNERHAGKDKEILAERIRVYEEARAKHPERWTRSIRKWEYQDTEWLNPRQEKETKNEAKA